MSTDGVYGGVNPEGKRMLRIEARNAETPMERKPSWIRTKLRTEPEYPQIRELVKSEGLHTVCQEAGCPNIYECWEDREATFLIGGEQCTRRCDFCQIDTGKPAPLDRDEPRRVAESVRTGLPAGVTDRLLNWLGGLIAHHSVPANRRSRHCGRPRRDGLLAVGEPG